MVSVGIDISKGKSMVCIFRPYGEVVMSPYEVNHTDEDLVELCERIKGIEEEVRVVMEATGAYHLPVLQQLKRCGIFVSVINPLLMKRYAQTSIRKGKTDKLDAIRIANYGIDNWFKLEDYQQPREVYEELRFLGRQYAHYIKIRVESKVSLALILDRTMPGIKKLIPNISRSDLPTKDKLSDFLEEYWHYDIITEFGEDLFVSNYCRWAKEKGYHASAAKAKAIYQVAESGIPTLSSSAASTKMLTLEAIKVLRETNKTLFVILTQMQKLATALPEYEIVRAMGGVGAVLAPRLIAEIGDVKKFRNGSALIAYAGLDSPPFESGAFVGTKRSISKRGSSLLRKTGYEVMSSLKTVKPVDDSVYKFMLKKESEGKPRKVAKIAALNKFLRIYYARVKEVYSAA